MSYAIFKEIPNDTTKDAIEEVMCGERSLQEIYDNVEDLIHHLQLMKHSLSFPDRTCMLQAETTEGVA